MHSLKRIKRDFNKLSLRATSLVVIGAFLFNIGHQDLVWARPQIDLRHANGAAILTAVWIADPLSPCQRKSIVNSPLSIENKILSTMDYKLLTNLRPLANKEKKTTSIVSGYFKSVFSLLDISDFQYVTCLARPPHSLMVVLGFRYEGEDKVLANGYALQKEKEYVIKFDTDEETQKTFIDYTLDLLAVINPDNTMPHLPVLAGYVEIDSVHFGGLEIPPLSGRGIVTEFIEGKILERYLDSMVDSFIDSIGQRSSGLRIQHGILETTLRVFKTYRATFAEKGLVHGDLNTKQIMLRQVDDGVIFFDNDTPTPARYESHGGELDEIVKARKRTTRWMLDNKSRESRLRMYLQNIPYIGIDKLCQPRDDIYSLCRSLWHSIRTAADVLRSFDTSEVYAPIISLADYLNDYANFASFASEVKYEDEEAAGGVLGGLIRKIEVLLEESKRAIVEDGARQGISPSLAPAPQPAHRTLFSSILRPRAAAQRLNKDEPTLLDLIERDGDYKWTRQVWTGGVSLEEEVNYYRELRNRCGRFLQGERRTRLPTYGYIADAHGNWDSWQQHMAEMEKRGVDIIVVLGDSMDRGPGGVSIMEDIIKRSGKGQRIVYVLGNHDTLFMKSMLGDAKAFLNWMGVGGKKTLIDAGITKETADEFYSCSKKFREADERRQKAMAELLANFEDQTAEEKYAEANNTINEAVNEMSDLIKKYDIASNPRLKAIFRWLRKNGLLYFIDAYDTFSIHAYVPMDKYGIPLLAFGGKKGFAALERVEKSIRKVKDMERLKKIDSKGKLLYKCTWKRGFGKLFSKKWKALLVGLRALRIIKGHEPQDEVGPANGRLIEADICTYSGDPPERIQGIAWVMVGPAGIKFIQNNKVVSKGALSGKKFLAEVSQECTRRLMQLERRSVEPQSTRQIEKPTANIEAAI